MIILWVFFLVPWLNDGIETNTTSAASVSVCDVSNCEQRHLSLREGEMASQLVSDIGKHDEDMTVKEKHHNLYATYGHDDVPRDN